MEHRRQFLRVGAIAIVLALAVRLVSAGFFTPILSFLRNPQVVSFLMYMQTGYVVRYTPPATEPTPTQGKEPEPPQPTQLPEAELPTFSGEEVTSVKYHCDYRPDLQTLLQKPLEWNLTTGGPKVLILHTHATETYADKTIEYSGAYRTLQEHYNMVSIGAQVAQVLRQGGVAVIHDKTLHDYPDYNNAYSAARATIEAYMEQYPSIEMVLDIHRDASDSTQGQLITSATAGGQKSAQLMMVVGTDAGGNYHPNWQENLSLALKLNALLERNNPGICRPIDLRTERFNMDFTAGSLLVEVGAAGNTHQEALIAAHALAQSILELSRGTK